MGKDKEQEGITKFDFFRYTPSKFLENTVFGALLTLAFLTFTGILVYHHVDEALGEGMKTEMLFENLQMTDLQVNMDIDVLHVPCEVVDLRFTAKQGSTHNLNRYHLKNALIKEKEQEMYIFQGNRAFDEMMKASREGEGCKIKGEFHLHFLSNNFFVGYGNPILLNNMMAKNPNYKMTLEHRINALSFGPNGSNQALT